MSSFYKRIISQKIISSAFGCQETSNSQHILKQLRRIIRVPPVRKDPFSGSHLMVELEALVKCLHGRSFDLDQLQIEDGVKVHEGQDGIHFKTDPGQFTKKVLEDIWSQKSSYGYLGQGDEVKDRVCVEYSSPNIAKPFHVGHLRSTILGNIISNMYEAAGHDVKRINFIGDWGTQFGLLSLGLQKYSDQEQLKTDPLLEFFKVYVKINQDVKSECGEELEVTSQTYQDGMALFARLEQGDKDMVTVWKMVTGSSTVELDKMYHRLGVHFTHVMPESDYRYKTKDVLQRLANLDLLRYDSDGVGYAQLDTKNIGRASIVKSDGSSLYLTRDIASALERQETFAFDKVHYVVEHGQRSHFTKLVNVLDKLGVPWAKRPVDEIHIRFGRVKGMSTRRGNIVFLRDILDEAKSRVLDSILTRSTSRVTDCVAEDVADTIGVSAIILQDVKANRVTDYTFSWEQMLSFKSDSGVFVHYCYARLCSMMSNCGFEVTEDIDVACVASDPALYGVALHLARYPDVFQDSLSSLEPHCIVQYLLKLCHLINGAYATCPVKGETTEIATARLLVFACSRQVLANCFRVLGLKLVEKM